MPETREWRLGLCWQRSTRALPPTTVRCCYCCAKCSSGCAHELCFVFVRVWFSSVQSDPPKTGPHLISSTAAGNSHIFSTHRNSERVCVVYVSLCVCVCRFVLVCKFCTDSVLCACCWRCYFCCYCSDRAGSVSVLIPISVCSRGAVLCAVLDVGFVCSLLVRFSGGFLSTSSTVHKEAIPSESPPERLCSQQLETSGFPTRLIRGVCLCVCAVVYRYSRCVGPPLNCICTYHTPIIVDRSPHDHCHHRRRQQKCR